MDDACFQRWSARLTELRKKRQTFIEEQLHEKKDSFGPDLFYDAAMRSLETIMEGWFEFEEQSWQEQPPPNPAETIEASIGEMESTLDFEIDAIDRDKAAVTSKITWDAETQRLVQVRFRAFGEDLRKRYQLKARGLGGTSPGKKKAAESAVATAKQTSVSGRSSTSSGVGLFMMFLVGLLLGGAPSFYFLDLSKKSERKFQEDRGKALSDQRALADSMAVLHDNYEQLALGKTKNIPELEKEIGKIKASILDRKQRVQNEFERERERVLKKVPAGDRQDKAINDLEALRTRKLDALSAEEKSGLDPLVKERDLLKDLLK